MFDKQVYIGRRAHLREKMSGGLVLILGNGEALANYTDNTYKFFQDSSFLYFFGLNHPGFAGALNAGIENLFTVTARKGLNPQYSFNGGSDDTYVTARVFNLGLTLNF